MLACPASMSLLAVCSGLHPSIVVAPGEHIPCAFASVVCCLVDIVQSAAHAHNVGIVTEAASGSSASGRY